MEEESTAMRDDSNMDTTEHDEHDTATTPNRDHDMITVDESMLDDADLAGSTPRPVSTKVIKADMSDMESPYEAMRREMKSEEDDHTTVLEDDDSSVLFAQQTARLPDMTMTPQALLDQRNKTQPSQQGRDPLLHRMLDKNYRLQATPHKSAPRATPLKNKDSADRRPPAKSSWQDSPMSSPDMAVPKLRSEAFMSPYKTMARQRFEAASQGPRTPGISVQTPATMKKSRQVEDVASANSTAKQKYEIDWDSDDDDADLYGGMSPPKTIQFALPPSKLLQTPGKCGQNPQNFCIYWDHLLFCFFILLFQYTKPPRLLIIFQFCCTIYHIIKISIQAHIRIHGLMSIFFRK